MRRNFLFLLYLFTAAIAGAQAAHKPVPDKLVVLSFDDAVSSHAKYVAPLLKKYRFGATFFVCEFPPDFADKTKYMSWEQIRQLDKMGFEVANHTHLHTHVNKMNEQQFIDQLEYIEQKCHDLGMKRLVSFAYPGYDTSAMAVKVLRRKGYRFARAGFNRLYDPANDQPYLIPSFTTLANNKEEIMNALQQAKDGKIAVLTIHGVPDVAHPWVTTPPELFEEYLQYLYSNHYHVIAVRDLEKYVSKETR